MFWRKGYIKEGVVFQSMVPRVEHTCSYVHARLVKYLHWKPYIIVSFIMMNWPWSGTLYARVEVVIFLEEYVISRAIVRRGSILYDNVSNTLKCISENLTINRMINEVNEFKPVSQKPSWIFIMNIFPFYPNSIIYYYFSLLLIFIICYRPKASYQPQIMTHWAVLTPAVFGSLSFDVVSYLVIGWIHHFNVS